MSLRPRLNSKRAKEQKEKVSHTIGAQYNKTGKPKIAARMNATTATEIKENTGKGRMWRRYLPWAIVLVVLNWVAVKMLYRSFFGYTSTNIETITLKPDHQDIVENYLTLIGLGISYTSLRKTSKDSNRYGRVEATFCKIDWDLQARNPSTIPMFKDLQAKSYFCEKTKTVVADFYDLVQQAKAFDGYVEGSSDKQNSSNNNKNNHNNGGVVFPPNGVVFHETRCGSTLFANLMASFAPGLSRVYSESPPPAKVLGACPKGYGEYCEKDLHQQLIRDVFYMMGRRPPNPTKTEESNYLFFKLQSINAMYIEKFAMAMPEVPWVFVYRDTVEIMQSHTNVGERAVPGRVCTRYSSYPEKDQPLTTLQIMQEAGKYLEDMTLTEYCAAHLAGLSLAAVQEYDRTRDSATPDHPGGFFVDYYQMPDVVWEKVFPDHFGVNPLPPNTVQNMQATAGVYSKGRGQKANQEWTEDSTIKRQTATPETIEAANLFASKVYKRMKELSGVDAV